MSKQYNKYLENHISNVNKGFEWFKVNLPEFIDEDLEATFDLDHDASKYDPEEYGAYDRYFYGTHRNEAVLNEFNVAWLHHIHCNPHHWQHWVLINDDPNEGTIVLDMPHRYIIEMICDWWAFSWAKGDLYEIFNWYDKHKAYIKLSPNTRETVEDILGKLKAKLDEGEKNDRL